MAIDSFNLTEIDFSVARLAQEQIGPHVREMEQEGKLKQSVVDMLFHNGVMLKPRLSGNQIYRLE